MQKRIAFLASIIKVDAEAANYFQQQDSQLFWEDSWFQCQFTPFFALAKKVHTKKPLRFLNCWYFCLVQFYWLYFITFCAYYLGQWMYVCKPCHAFFAHFPRNLTIKKSLKFRCHFEWISPWKCRESVRWWRSLWVSLSARSRFGPAQATLNLGLRRFSRIRPDYSQVSNS